MEFTKWLGKEIGKDMIAYVAKDGSVNQVRAAVITYCCLFDVLVDTREWDELIKWIYDNYNSYFNTYEEFDMYMSADLI